VSALEKKKKKNKIGATPSSRDRAGEIARRDVYKNSVRTFRERENHQTLLLCPDKKAGCSRLRRGKTNAKPQTRPRRRTANQSRSITTAAGRSTHQRQTRAKKMREGHFTSHEPHQRDVGGRAAQLKLKDEAGHPERKTRGSAARPPCWGKKGSRSGR